MSILWNVLTQHFIRGLPRISSAVFSNTMVNKLAAPSTPEAVGLCA